MFTEWASVTAVSSPRTSPMPVSSLSFPTPAQPTAAVKLPSRRGVACCGHAVHVGSHNV